MHGLASRTESAETRGEAFLLAALSGSRPNAHASLLVHCVPRIAWDHREAKAPPARACELVPPLLGLWHVR